MRRLLAAGLSCVVSTLPASAAGPAGTPALGEALARFDRAIRAEMDTGASPGLAAAIVLDGETLWTASYGSADVAADRPVDRSSRFILGSISKLFTALAIVQLRDAGKLGLDDAVTRHLPWFTLAGTPRPTLTLRELLLQLGGLPREPIGASWLDRVMPTKEDLVRTMADEAPALPPETAWKYSNLGYAVLGLVVEAASGESYADYVAGHITRPLGMVDTVAAPRADTPGLVTGYGAKAGGRREPRAFLAMGGVLPAAGIASTAADMARFAAFLLDERDGPVLSAQSRREMMRVQAVFPDWTGGQGLGFELRRTGDGTRIGHAGRAAGFAARFDIDPAHHLGVVILTNADDGAPTRLVDRALALLAPVVDAGRPAPPIDPSWQRYVGTFVHKEGSNAFALVDGRLAWVDPGAAEPARTRIFLDPAGPDRFRFASGGLIGEIVTFQTDPAGRVIGVQAGGTLYWKQ